MEKTKTVLATLYLKAPPVEWTGCDCGFAGESDRYPYYDEPDLYVQEDVKKLIEDMNTALKANTVPACPICLFAWFGLVFCVPCSLSCFFESFAKSYLAEEQKIMDDFNTKYEENGVIVEWNEGYHKFEAERAAERERRRQLDTWYIRDHWISNGLQSACNDYNVGLNIVKVEKENVTISTQTSVPGIVEDIEFT